MDPRDEGVKEMSVFPTGGANEAYARYFTGKSYLHMLSQEQVVIGNVTFEPGCRNDWHIHHAAAGGGQVEQEAQFVSPRGFAPASLRLARSLCP